MNVLVVSPHPDDESIGCGGTLARHVAAGDNVTIIFLTSGERGGKADSAVLARIREQEARRASKVLGVSKLDFWRQPDGSLTANRQLVGRLANIAAEIHAELVYTTHAAESHPDHRAAARLVHQAFNGAGVECRYFEVWTPLTRIAEIVDISDFLNVKLRAIRSHRSQVELVGFVAAARGLARYRGELHSWPGGPYAEAFGGW